MFECFLSQILILLLILACNVRILFIKNPRVDCFAVFSPCATIIAAINLLCFDLSLINIILFILAIFTSLINFRSVLRLRARLLVDHYSTSFVVFTIISLLITVFSLAVIIYFRPVRLNPSKFNATKTQISLTGKSIESIRLKTDYFQGEKPTGMIYIYEPSEKEKYSYKPVLIFAGTNLGQTKFYEPYFFLLAQKGYSVMAADFFTKDTEFFQNPIMNFKNARRLFTLRMKQFDTENYHKLEEFEDNLAAKKYETLSKFSYEFFGDDRKFGYIVDCVSFDSIYSVVEKFTENSMGFFSINRIEEYETPGFGFIGQTEPIFASYQKKQRDTSLFIPRYVALKTAEAFPVEEPKPEEAETAEEAAPETQAQDGKADDAK